MKTVRAVRSTQISVICGNNDSVDIRCGGPSTLGYDFYVDPKKTKELFEHVKDMLRKYNRPCRGISVIPKSKLVEIKDLWTALRITRCIKDIKPI